MAADDLQFGGPELEASELTPREKAERDWILSENGDAEAPAHYQRAYDALERAGIGITPEDLRDLVALLASAHTSLPTVTDALSRNGAPSYEIVDWDELEATPPLRWLVRDLLPKGGFSIMVGDPKAGKSTLTRCLVATMAGGGGRWLGRYTDGGKVLYLAMDEHRAMTRDHLQKMASRDVLQGRVQHIFSHVPPADLAYVAKGYDLVVIDTLGQMAAGIVQNGDSYMDWPPMMRSIRGAADETDAHFLLVHHARKSGGNAIAAVLGSQAIAGAVDTIIHMSTETDEVTGVKKRYVTSTNRAGVDVDKTRLILDGDTGWLSMGDRMAGPPTVRTQVIDMARHYGPDGITKTEAAANIRARSTEVRAAIDALIDEGKIIQPSPRSRCYWHESYEVR